MISGDEPINVVRNSRGELVRLNDFTSNGRATGITLRQYYAGLAMQGLCASGFFTEIKLQQQAENAGSNISKVLAISALDIADEMINQLNKDCS